MKHANIKDVAKSAGVSISTVSRYLANPSSIKPTFASAVEKAINELKYIPNPFAQNLKSEHTNNIAIIIPDISNQFFSEACKALCTVLYRNKYFVMICDTDDNPEKEQYYINEMIKSRAAGIILVTCGQNTEFVKTVVNAGHRIVLLDRMEPSIKVDTVCADKYRAGYDLAKHLVRKGHRHYAILSGSENSINMQFIISGIKNAFAESSVSINESCIITNLRTKESAAHEFELLLANKKNLSCVIACNSVLLDGIVLAANRLQLNIPEDCEIAGFSIDDPRYAYPFPVPAIMEIPAQLGAEVGELMLRLLASESDTSVAKQILLNCQLILSTQVHSY